MEFQTRVIRKCQEKGRAFSQITLDDDYIVPDSRPDVIKIIHTQGNIIFEETRISNQAVWMKGRLDFSVLYRSDQEENKIETTNGSIPFQEKLVIDGVEELDPLKMSWTLEDISVTLINSRKLGIRALADILVIAEENKDEDIPYGVEGEQYQQKVAEQEVLRLVSSKKDILRIRNELTLPNAKPNIHRLLWYCINPRNMEPVLANGKILMNGEAQIGILYKSAEDEQIQWYETMMPVQGEIDCGTCEESDIFWTRAEPVTLELEARSDYDGEERLLGIEIALDVDIKLWKEETISVLEDVFALDRRVIPHYEQSMFQKLLVKNAAKIRLAEQIKLEKDQERILQICSCEGNIGIDHTTITEDGIMVEGVLNVHALYVTADDNFPVSHFAATIPFEQLIEVPGIKSDVQFEIESGIDQLGLNLMDNSECEMKAVVSLCVIALEPFALNRLVNVEEEPLNVEELQKQPGLVGYVVRAQEDLWDIAKQYHTTVEELISTNSLKSRKVKPGTKIMIVKKVS